MKSLEQLPTDENLKEALEKDLLSRNVPLIYFINLLQELDSVYSIALDGPWGSGKTFFVKQIMMLTNENNPSNIIPDEELKTIMEQSPFKDNLKQDAEKCALAVYYDAWSNDNDTDPILSIIYEITMQLNLAYSFKSEQSVINTVASIAELLTGRNVTEVIKSFKTMNSFENLKKQKKMETEMKNFFTYILEERGNRLIVIIDELDRCKPSYAVQLLERIKHYFNDDRVTFIFSVNLKELQHTIKRYYGEGFDAGRYLDRFFDMILSLPLADKVKFYDEIGLNLQSATETVTRRFIYQHKLELRESLRMYSLVRAATYEFTHDDGKYRPTDITKILLIGFIVPIAIGLRIIDTTLYDDFVNGKSPSLLVDMLNTEEFVNWIVERSLENDESFEGEDGKKLVTVENKIKDIYYAIFKNEYSGRCCSKKIGEFQFSKDSRNFVLCMSNLMSGKVHLK